MLILKNKKASILIYAIVLTIIALILASVLLSNRLSLYSNQVYYKLNTRFFNQIKSNNTLNYDNIIKTNTDGGWFVDIYSGSGANIRCRIQSDWTYLVEWDDWIKNGWDWYDDNCNSDNYLWSNTWTIRYMSGFEDNDNIARKNLIWIIVPWQQKNIFWNNSKIEEFIDENPNNIDIYNKTLSWVTNWYLYLNLSTWSLLTLIEYDKNRYNNTFEIKEIASFTWIVSWSWYIENNSNILSLNSITWSNTFSFNFKDSWYLLFLTNTGTNLINYSLSWFENTWSWIYLNPINDYLASTWSIEILGYDVVINDSWNIFWKMLKKVFEK